MKKLLFALFLIVQACQHRPVFAQDAPDCQLLLGQVTAPGTNIGPFDNRTRGCTYWVFTYNSTGFSALSIIVQTAPNNAGVPGSWSTFTAVSGSNPNTNTTAASSTFGSISGGTTSYFPWLRVQLTSVTGSGAVTGVLYGWKVPPEAAATGCPGTVATPCVVVGPTAAGSPSTTNPVQIGGVDTFGNVRKVATTTGGDVSTVALSGSATLSDAISAAGNVPIDAASNQVVRQTVSYRYNGSTFDPDFNCTNQASFNLSGSGNTQIIAASGSTTIRICHISFSTTATEDIKITRGTGSNCGTGTADVTGLYKSIQSLALDFAPTAALRGAASGAICINQSAAQALGGIVIYAQF